MNVLFVLFGLVLSGLIVLSASTTSDLAIADPSTIVYEGLVRFTVLSAQLIRLEWSPTKDFVDAKTWVVQSRQIQLTPPTFNVTRVTIRVNDETVVWNAKSGEEYDGNLLGTVRTLDRNNDSKLELDCQLLDHIHLRTYLLSA